MARPSPRPFGALATSTARARTEYLVGAHCIGRWRRLSQTLLSLTVLAWLSSVTPLHAQSASEETRVWASVGLGEGKFQGKFQGSDGVAGLLELVVQPGTQRFSIRGGGVSDIFNETVSEFGVLYGHAWRGERSPSSFSVSAGVARVGSDYCDYVAEQFRCTHTISLPFSAEVTWPFSRVLGLGLQAFGNINSVSNFAAVALTLQLGRLR